MRKSIRSRSHGEWAPFIQQTEDRKTSLSIEVCLFSQNYFLMTEEYLISRSGWTCGDCWWGRQRRSVTFLCGSSTTLKHYSTPSTEVDQELSVKMNWNCSLRHFSTLENLTTREWRVLQTNPTPQWLLMVMSNWTSTSTSCLSSTFSSGSRPMDLASIYSGRYIFYIFILKDNILDQLVLGLKR